MSMLTVNHPITFEVDNPFHRRMFACFLEHNKWMPESPRFVLEHPYVNVPLMIQTKLLKYYIDKELNINQNKGEINGKRPKLQTV